MIDWKLTTAEGYLHLNSTLPFFSMISGMAGKMRKEREEEERKKKIRWKIPSPFQHGAFGEKANWWMEVLK